MHRSGTSVVSKALQMLGVELGPDEDLLPPAADNPKGFWENRSINTINDKVLRTLGGDWANPPDMLPGWERDERFDLLRQEATAVLAKLFGGAEFAGWKDPRTSLTLPFWRSVTPIESTVLVLRNPDEVARSLLTRQGVDPDRAMLLWTRYVVAALRNDPDHLQVLHEAIYDDPDGMLRSIASHCELSAPTSDQTDAFRSYVQNGLRNHHAAKIDAPAHGPLARAIYDCLVSGDARRFDPLFEALDGLKAYPFAIVEERSRANEVQIHEFRSSMKELVARESELAERAASAEAALARQRIDRDRLNQWDDLVRRREVLERTVEGAQAENAELVNRDQTTRGELARLHAELDVARAKLDVARAKLDDRSVLLERLTHADARIQRRDQDVVDLQRTVQQGATAKADAQRVLAEARQQHQRLAGRRSVQVALGVASLGRPLFRVVRKLRRMISGRS